MLGEPQPRDPDCTFCRIISGQLPAEVVVDDPEVVGILDHRPLFPGHVLVLPRDHHEVLADLPPSSIEPLFVAVRRVAVAVEATMGAGGTFVAVNNRVSQSVPHLHVHVVPRTKGDGLRGFFWPRTPYDDPGHMAEVAARLRAALAG